MNGSEANDEKKKKWDDLTEFEYIGNSGGQTLTDDMFIQLCEQHPHLQSVSLFRGELLTSRSLIRLANLRLQFLDISATQIEPDLLCHLFRSSTPLSTTLTSLSVAFHERLTNDALLEILYNAENIQEVNISYCPHISFSLLQKMSPVVSQKETRQIHIRSTNCSNEVQTLTIMKQKEPTHHVTATI